MEKFSSIPGIGPKTLEKLQKLGIAAPRDLLFHFPHRYIDFSKIIPISNIEPFTNVTIRGTIRSFQNIYTRHGKNIQKAIIADQSGGIELIWFNQPYLSTTFKVGDEFSVAGSVELFQNKPTIISPEFGPYNTGKIIAVYPETSGLTSKWFRKTIQTYLPELVKGIKETLPEEVIKKNNLMPLSEALTEIHTPKNSTLLEQARYRLSLDEIISYQAKSYLLKKERLTYHPKYSFKLTATYQKNIDKFIASLPFELTDSQKNVWQEIMGDLISDKPANRLLQGDVGSGKTIVAALACYLASLNGTISLLIAPTEILARQHFATFQKILNGKIKTHLLTSSSKIIPKDIKKNDIIIATHAAIFHKKHFEDRVGLLIVDEQHKFGVNQRNFLSNPTAPVHTLTMTATPIPRTISLTMLGNLDLSVIKELPKNRQAIKTFLVPQNKISGCYQWIGNEIQKTGCQAFIVCPFIEESETMQSVKSAKKEFDYLSKSIFPHLKLALIHGKDKPKDRDLVIQEFQKNKINILVTTPIIEVGIDIPNSSIIVIQSADRFGLAQLHQLRGRVGRGAAQSYCYLFTESQNDKAQKRLEFLTSHLNGLDVAEYDLRTRGPGSAFSTLQHGFMSLKLADISNLDLIKSSQKVFDDIVTLAPQFDFRSLLEEEAGAVSYSN